MSVKPPETCTFPKTSVDEGLLLGKNINKRFDTCGRLDATVIANCMACNISSKYLSPSLHSRVELPGVSHLASSPCDTSLLGKMKAYGVGMAAKPSAFSFSDLPSSSSHFQSKSQVSKASSSKGETNTLFSEELADVTLNALKSRRSVFYKERELFKEDFTVCHAVVKDMAQVHGLGEETSERSRDKAIVSGLLDTYCKPGIAREVKDIDNYIKFISPLSSRPMGMSFCKGMLWDVKDSIMDLYTRTFSREDGAYGWPSFLRLSSFSQFELVEERRLQAMSKGRLHAELIPHEVLLRQGGLVSTANFIQARMNFKRIIERSSVQDLFVLQDKCIHPEIVLSNDQESRLKAYHLLRPDGRVDPAVKSSLISSIKISMEFIDTPLFEEIVTIRK